MSIVEIEAAITKLPPSDVDKLMTWLADHHARLWDKQIGDDLDAGRLDKVLDEVDREIEAGQATPL